MCARNQYRPEKIANWGELLGWYQKLSQAPAGQGKGWVFRGQGNPQYGLSTSLERACLSYGHQRTEFPSLERRIIREFKRRLHHYTTDPPHKKDMIEWLALMQHYGAPTRLLDWTYSFFIGVYFAVESAGQDHCVLWALKMEPFKAHDVLSEHENVDVEERYQRYLCDDTSLKDEAWLRQCALVDHLFDRPRPLIHSVNPFRLNDRLTIQQGLFLMPGDISRDFEENMMVHSSSPKDLIRFEIDSTPPVRREILINLHRMNISRASLFPGLVGFAESLKTRLAFPDLMS
jgi:hypothetical protein